METANSKTPNPRVGLPKIISSNGNPTLDNGHVRPYELIAACTAILVIHSSVLDTMCGVTTTLSN